nr:immunoglobulin heavy chain junction region [Macaca mulatta]MOW98252.1 immunoglobulin heavy chain junction region [Macaca mulatta]MOW98560.1 immunoglobulin heavy chain junction region [Macaca mulatta]MOW98806.1 immunoglobulin heavy chain junction region [Macaca mulatta]MOW98923.1 immunoglobulin heavy chain junction region [Macaca mulatta]
CARRSATGWADYIRYW